MFTCHFEKAIAVIGYIFKKNPNIKKTDLMDIIYIADRNHFVQYGRSITSCNYEVNHNQIVPVEVSSILRRRDSIWMFFDYYNYDMFSENLSVSDTNHLDHAIRNPKEHEPDANYMSWCKDLEWFTKEILEDRQWMSRYFA